MNTVHADIHGLFVRAGGYVFRPVFPVGYQHVYKDGTALPVGAKVKATHQGGTPLAKVGNETWFSHGAYHATEGTSASWKPSYEQW